MTPLDPAGRLLRLPVAGAITRGSLADVALSVNFGKASPPRTRSRSRASGGRWAQARSPEVDEGA